MQEKTQKEAWMLTRAGQLRSSIYGMRWIQSLIRVLSRALSACCPMNSPAGPPRCPSSNFCLASPSPKLKAHRLWNKVSLNQYMAEPMTSCFRGNRRRTFFGHTLFGYDFNGANGGIVRHRSEIDLEFALGGRFNVREGFHQRPGAGFLKNI